MNSGLYAISIIIACIDLTISLNQVKIGYLHILFTSSNDGDRNQLKFNLCYSNISDSYFCHFGAFTSQNRVVTNLENMKNPENSGNLKTCQNIRENSGRFEFLHKNLKTSGKM